MAPLTLIYFQFTGYAEKLRLLFADAGVEYKDEYVTGETLGALKPELAFGSVPAVREGDKTRVDSFALFRYYGARYNYYPTDIEARYLVDLIIAGTSDLQVQLMNATHAKVEEGQARLREAFVNTTAPRKLAELEALVKNHGGEFATGSTISLADIYLFDCFYNFAIITPALSLDSYPTLKALVERIGARPAIVAHNAARKVNSYTAWA